MRGSGSIRAGKLWLLSAVAPLLHAPAANAETRAGTPIDNIARLTFDTAGGRAATDSNASRIVVAERLDVTLDAGPIASAVDGTPVAVAILRNTGNGNEAFAVTAAMETGTVRSVAIDRDGDGRYDAARDALLTDSRTAPIAPGESVTLFAAPAPGPVGAVVITAAAVTGYGTPGTGFAATGDGGGDAIVGPTGARASITLSPGSSTGTAPTLAKTAVVSAPDGTTRAVRGATITYALVARFPTATQGAAVGDPVPAGTSYVPGSLTLDDAALSDATDADAGDATPARITVALGDQPAGAVRTIRFKVIIQ